MLNNLNTKVQKFNEQKKQVEDEILKNLLLTTNTLNTDRSLAELSEMLTIQDYQSVMDSLKGTETVPTARDNVTDKKTHHGKNQPSFCKTQNIADILRSMNDPLASEVDNILSVNPSV